MPNDARQVLVGAQDAEAGAGDGAQELVVALALELVLAVAEEREVVVGQPLEEGPALVELLGRSSGGGSLVELVDDLDDLGVHLVPVLDGLADVAQHPLEGVGDRVGVLVVVDPVDLDVHPRLALGRPRAAPRASLLGAARAGARR